MDRSGPILHLSMHRDVDVPDFTRVGILVSESDVSPGARYRLVPEVGENRDDLPAGERRPDHRGSVHELGEFAVPVPLVGILDRVATTLVEFEGFRELGERLGTSVTAAGQSSLQIPGSNRALVLADEFDAFEAIVLPGGARHLPRCWAIRGRDIRPNIEIRPSVFPARPCESVEVTSKTILDAYEISGERNHDVYDCFYIALARDADADALVTTDRDFEELCEDEPFEYTNPVPDEILSEFHPISTKNRIADPRKSSPGVGVQRLPLRLEAALSKAGPQFASRWVSMRSTTVETTLQPEQSEIAVGERKRDKLFEQVT